mgnify:CR=1 FL=1
MATQQFNFDVLQVGASSGVAEAALSEMKNIQEEVVTYDVLNTLDGVAKVAAKVKQDKDTVDGITAKTDINQFINSDAYINSNDTERVDLWDEWQNNLGDTSPAYQSAWINSSAARQFQARSGRKQELDMSNLNAAYTAFESEKFKTSSITPTTNVNSPQFLESFIDNYANTTNLEKPEISNMIMATKGQEDLELIRGANNEEQLKEVLLEINETDAMFKDNKFLYNNSNKTKQLVTAMQRERSSAITGKQKEFVMNAKNYLSFQEQNNYAETSYNMDKTFKTIAYNSATGKIDEGKYNEIKSKYEEDQQLTWDKNYYDESKTPTTQLTIEQKANKFIKKEHPKYVLDSLNDAMTDGSTKDFGDIVQSQGPYLSDYKAQSLNKLFNTDLDKDDQVVLWSQFDEMLQSPNGAANMKTIFGKETARVQGVINMVRYGGLSHNQAIEAISKYEAAPDRKKLDKDLFQQVSDYGKDYGPLNNEFQDIIKYSVASGGADIEGTIDRVSEEFDKRVTTIGDTVAFDITGQAPVPSNNAESIYNTNVGIELDKFKKLNEGNPVQIEILNNGKAIVKDSTFGYKIGTYIDLEGIKNKAETQAIEDGPTAYNKTKTALGMLVDSLTTSGGKAVESETVLIDPILENIHRIIPENTRMKHEDNLKRALNNLENMPTEISNDISNVVHSVLDSILSRDPKVEATNQSIEGKKELEKESTSIKSEVEVVSDLLSTVNYMNDAKVMTRDEFIAYGPKTSKGMSSHIYNTDEEGNMLPEGYFRKAGTVIKVTDF